MIRIDEIYYNVFVKGLQHQPDIALHWFDPFGSVGLENICSVPPLLLPEKRLIFWDQEPLYLDNAKNFLDQFRDIYQGPITIVTSERESTDLAWICDTYGLDSAYYFFHGWAALDWYRGYNHSYLSTPQPERNIKHPLFIPNNIIGGRRQHRIRLLSALHQRDAIRQNLISFPKICPYEKIPAHDISRAIGIDLDGIDLPLIIDDDINHAADSHKIAFWQQAQQCFCHVVTETVWENRLHVTEKTFKPIVMQQPFVLVGSRHALAYLREYGFKTFDNIWNETYDTLPDDQRMEAIAKVCEMITHWDSKTLSSAHKEARSVVEHNFKWFYGGFQDILWEELTKMLQQWQ